MQALTFYLTYPFIYGVASLPFPLVYALSDFFSWVIAGIGYRKEVIQTNLRNSFPEKSEEEIKSLTRDYYRYLCDLSLETIKTMKMTEAQHKERVVLENPEVMEQLYQQGRSIILILGHFGNWEWYGPCVTLNTKFQLVVIYRPLTQPYFEKMTSAWRTRFGTEITPVNQTIRTMVANKNRITATAFVADQAAPINAYWTTFLNQETSVFTGAEKMGSKFNYPIVYLHATRPRRGYYTIRAEVLFQDPVKTVENEISEAFTRRLEVDIVDNPTIWLWSHKRWKIKRSASNQGV